MNTQINPTEIIIFGSGECAEIIGNYVLENNMEIKTFTDINPAKTELINKPVIDYSEILKDKVLKKLPIFVAIGYKELNAHREEKISLVENDKWTIANICFSSIKAINNKIKGCNIFIANNVSIQPNAVISSGVYLWDNSVVGHNSEIGPNNWLTAGTVIGGHSKLGRNCFLGINSSINHMIRIGDYSFIGSGCTISKNLQDKTVVFKQSDKEAEFNSEFFIRTGALK